MRYEKPRKDTCAQAFLPELNDFYSEWKRFRVNYNKFPYNTINAWKTEDWKHPKEKYNIRTIPESGRTFGLFHYWFWYLTKYVEDCPDTRRCLSSANSSRTQPGTFTGIFLGGRDWRILRATITKKMLFLVFENCWSCIPSRF
jgi:hypothetical protein